jgi:hypothetical protein
VREKALTKPPPSFVSVFFGSTTSRGFRTTHTPLPISFFPKGVWLLGSGVRCREYHTYKGARQLAVKNVHSHA